ncbi:MAG: diguanylate cyclase [Rhodocyclales bacterium]|nr:diguanylate cyclase [Rhodocyclales bacterium]
MTGKLTLLCCENFRPEIAAAVAAEGWPDVSVAAFPARCGRPPLSWYELHPLLGPAGTRTAVIGNVCLAGLETAATNAPAVKLLRQEQCFHMVAGHSLVDEAIARGAYLITPGWLADWRGKLSQMGFDEVTGGAFFRDFVRELVLLDTGTLADAPARLAEMATALGLPGTRVGIGLDPLRHWLGRLVAEWRLDDAGQRAAQRERERAREVADHKAAMDFLGRLPLLKDEQETIAAIGEMFHLLFAPQVFCYLHVEGGCVRNDCNLPPDLLDQAQNLGADWTWTTSGKGFLLRIARADEALGVIVVEQLAFPEYRDRYLDLALSISGVAGLSIDNARSYRRLMELQRELEREAHTDVLTGCVSRRHFLDVTRLELARSRRHDEEVSLLMLDLDHFKAINDLHGHLVGDLVLQKMVQVCTATLRSEDTIGRLGGEEFAVLLPETGRDRALEVAERLCAGLAAAEVPLDGEPAIRFTVSIGVATLTADDFSVSAMLDRADHALYKAKRRGRNRVVAA